MGTCEGKQQRGNHDFRYSKCCLPPGKYTLKCKDSLGNGWEGGHVKIAGIHYCTGFTKGYQKSHQILIDSNGKPTRKISIFTILWKFSFI